MKRQSSIKTVCMMAFFVIAALGSAAAQTGTITGTVVDSQNGEPLVGSVVKVEGTNKGAVCDMDGNFRIERVEAGTYTISTQIIGYTPKKITDVEVKAGEVTRLDFSVDPETIEVDEVVVKAQAVRNTEAVLLKDRQKAEAVSDAVSAEQISKSGSGDAAEAMKQVTGASVVDGNQVVVRGLGDRYTNVQLNGAELPSANPYKKSAPMDILPTNLLNNITTLKSFTPDKPGNFSGGAVDVQTKSFPDQLTVSVSTSGSYNTQSNFNSDFLTYDGSSSDWLGYDNGKRDIPNEWKPSTKDYSSVIPPDGRDPVENVSDLEYATENMWDGAAPLYNHYMKAFNTVMAPYNGYSGMNQSYSVAVGNQVPVFGRAFGFLGSLTYKNKFSYYDNGRLEWWDRTSADSTSTGLNLREKYDVKRGVHDVQIGGLANFAYKITPEHEVGFNAIYTQNGEKSATSQVGVVPDQFGDNDEVTFHFLRFNERNMQSYQLNGKHLIQPALNSRIEWRATRSLASQDEPDFREFNYLESENGQYENGGGWLHDPNRIYRFMEEDRNEYALDWIMPFKQWSGESGNVKFGGLTAHKNRDFNHRQYTYRTYNRDSDYSFNGAEGDIDTWLGWTGVVGTDTVAAGTPFETIKNEIGVTISENYFDVSEYDAEQDINAWYGMLDIPLITNFRMITGARFESTDMQVSAFDNSKDSLVVGSIVEDDILPSVNFIYGLSENMNIRVAYGKTLARPTFREMAPYFSYEVEGFYLNGNPELKRTLIDNFDVRWEWFTRPGEIYAVSVFRKNFDDPIERTFTNVNKYVQYQNVDEAEVTGLEVEARKRLDQINPALEYFQIGGNASFTSSSIDIPQTELQFIEQSTGRKVDTDRPFQGQSPYIFNANASYDNTESGTSTSFFYNVFGERLYSVSFSGTPDVYEMPRHTLNWTFSQRLMENLSFKAGVDNILDAERRFEYEDTFPGKTYVFRSYKTGRTISVGLSYKL